MTSLPQAAASAAASDEVRWLSAYAGKRFVERWWLGYTAVWGLACAVVMFGGFAERWTDREFLPFSVVLASVAWFGPTLWVHPSERALAWHRRTGFRFGLSVVLFACGMNYVGTPFFFDVLHMHYGFRSMIAIEGNPVFLYLLTIAYFSTYAVLCSAAWRWAGRRGGGALRVVRATPMVLLIAALETLLNANPSLAKVFCYDDMPLMLTFGTFCYGVSLAFAMPLWGSLGERGPDPRPLWHIVAEVALALVGIAVAFALLRWTVAPLFTTVIDNAAMNGDAGCLAR